MNPKKRHILRYFLLIPVLAGLLYIIFGTDLLDFSRPGQEETTTSIHFSTPEAEAALAVTDDGRIIYKKGATVYLKGDNGFNVFSEDFTSAILSVQTVGNHILVHEPEADTLTLLDLTGEVLYSNTLKKELMEARLLEKGHVLLLSRNAAVQYVGIVTPDGELLREEVTVEYPRLLQADYDVTADTLIVHSAQVMERAENTVDIYMGGELTGTVTQADLMVSVSVEEDTVYIANPDRVLAYSTRGRKLYETAVEGSILSMQVSSGHVGLLTRREKDGFFDFGKKTRLYVLDAAGSVKDSAKASDDIESIFFKYDTLYAMNSENLWILNGKVKNAFSPSRTMDLIAAPNGCFVAAVRMDGARAYAVSPAMAA